MIDVALLGAGLIGQIHAGNLVRQRDVRAVRCTIDDAVQAQGLAAAATRSWKEGRVVSMSVG